MFVILQTNIDNSMIIVVIQNDDHNVNNRIDNYYTMMKQIKIFVILIYDH